MNSLYYNVIPYCFVGLRLFILYNILYILLNKSEYVQRKNKIVRNKLMEIFNNLQFIKKVEILVYELERINKINRKFNFVNIYTLVCVSLLLSTLVYIWIYNLIFIKSSALIIASISFFIPYMILKYMIKRQKEDIFKNFPNYIISLKNYTQVNNDIVFAFKKVITKEPLSIYINRFNVSLENGINIHDAFERLKIDIGIEKISQFITLLQFCYINGGDFNKLLERYSKIMLNINMQKEKEKQQMYSSKFAIVVLIIINIYVVMYFVMTNKDYFNIVTGTTVGVLIMNINIISHLAILCFMIKINKLEE